MIGKRLLAGLLTTLLLTFGAAGGATAAWAGTSTTTSYAASQQATRTEVVVGLGDSVTSGYRSDESYVRALAASLTTATTAAAADNFGVPGLTTTGLLAQLNLPQVQSALEQADLVVITIGANDFTVDDADAPDLDDQLTALRQHMALVLSEVQAYAPNARIVVTGYWNAFTDASVSGADQAYTDTAMGLTERINTVLQQTATGTGTGYVDLVAAFNAASSDWSTLLADDGDHPNEAGHEAIAAAIGTVIRGSTTAL
ncbi:SGNH/GDSL hydrolase family protein [Naumannella sp. ID2617S]|nr:SGNH/GDSL hydrolase family protein [Naumannella sp. ID2617S]